MNIKEYCALSRTLATHRKALQVVCHFLDGLPDRTDNFYVHVGLHGWQDIAHAHETTPVIQKILKTLGIAVGIELVDNAEEQTHYRIYVK